MMAADEARRRGLGRGLSALLGEDPVAAAEWDRKAARIESDAALSEIAAAEVARLEAEFSDERLQELIRSHGSAGES